VTGSELTNPTESRSRLRKKTLSITTGRSLTFWPWKRATEADRFLQPSLVEAVVSVGEAMCSRISFPLVVDAGASGAIRSRLKRRLGGRQAQLRLRSVFS
jgi:hypothetical protein